MLSGWGNYFFLIGSAAAALIGLMFIVATLTSGREPGQLEQGKKLYTSPILCHLGVVLILSAAAVAPSMLPRWFGWLAILLAAAGMAYGTRIAIGIARAALAENFSGFDIFWYGLAPSLAYGALGMSGVAMVRGYPWSPSALAGSAMALLLVSIHNEWDLVTFLAPRSPGPGGQKVD